MTSFSQNGHDLSFQETGVLYRDLEKREFFFSYQAPLKVKHHPWSGRTFLNGPAAKAPLSFLTVDLQKKFLQDFFRRWSSANPDAAKKAAFDYSEDGRGLYRTVLGVCFLFTLPMAVALLNEGWDQARCTKALHASSQEGVMNVSKVKKVTKDNYILTLDYIAPNGRAIRGYDRAQSVNEDSLPKSIPILFSPEHPECWAQANDFGRVGVSWAKRRYFSVVSFLLGLFFLGLSAYGFQWAAGRLLRPRPFREEVRAIFQL